MPASNAAGIFSDNKELSVARALFSPSGLVLGNIGDTVSPISSVCSSRKWHKQSTRLLNVAKSFNRLDAVDRATILRKLLMAQLT